MAAKQQRLDRFLSHRLCINMRDVKPMLAQGRILIDEQPATSADQRINTFTHITVDGQDIQRNTARYIMLNKPKDVVSATKDPEHTTAIELLEEPIDTDLHIAGRLDRSSTGLLLLTNDSRWSEGLMTPSAKAEKVYIVELARPLEPQYFDAFASGIHFPFEDILTRPAILEQLSDKTARVTLTEGRYHQIKRMFGHFRNRVVSLHRIRIGHITLDDSLAPGAWRQLRQDEVNPDTVADRN